MVWRREDRVLESLLLTTCYPRHAPTLPSFDLQIRRLARGSQGSLT